MSPQMDSGTGTSSVNDLVKCCNKPVPRPIPTMTAQVPTHITQNIDPNLYPHLQAAVDTAHQQRGASSTPYTPSGSIRPPLALRSTDSNPLPTLPTISNNNRCTVAMQPQQHGGQFAGSQYAHGAGGTVWGVPAETRGSSMGSANQLGSTSANTNADPGTPTPPPRRHNLSWAAFLAPQLPHPQDMGLTGALLGHLYSMSEHLWLILMY